MIVDPLGFWAAFDDTPEPAGLMEMLSGGAFGSAQLVLGTSANMVMGQVYNLAIGPPPITLHTNNWTGFMILAKVLGTIMLGLSAVFVVAYGAVGSVWDDGDLHADDDRRADIVMAFQALMQLCIFTLIMVHNNHANALEKLAVDTIVPVYVQGYKVGDLKIKITQRLLADCVVIAEILAAGIVPDLLEAHGEDKLHGLDDKKS